MFNHEQEPSLRERIGSLEIEYWRPDSNRGATEDIFYINTQDKEVFDLFRRACTALDGKVQLDGMRKPLNLFPQIGPNSTIGEIGFECMEENLPPHKGLEAEVMGLIREKMLELAEQ